MRLCAVTDEMPCDPHTLPWQPRVESALFWSTLLLVPAPQGSRVWHKCLGPPRPAGDSSEGLGSPSWLSPRLLDTCWGVKQKMEGFCVSPCLSNKENIWPMKSFGLALARYHQVRLNIQQVRSMLILKSIILNSL